MSETNKDWQKAAAKLAADLTALRAVAAGSTFLRWADYDPSYTGNNRLSIYATKADQRGNRPDLKPLKVRVTIL